MTVLLITLQPARALRRGILAPAGGALVGVAIGFVQLLATLHFVFGSDRATYGHLFATLAVLCLIAPAARSRVRPAPGTLT